jgi:hypothetical protein
MAIELSAECLGLAATEQARLTDDLSPKSRANRAVPVARLKS